MREFVHNDFALGLPDGWADASVVVVAGTPNDGYSPSITITREQLDYEVDAYQYATRQLKDLQEELAQSGFQVREEGAFALPGVSAYRRVHSFEISDLAVSVTQMQVYVIRGAEAVTLTCTNLSEWFPRTLQTFLDAVKQFRWQ
jgi:hypothetical protein